MLAAAMAVVEAENMVGRDSAGKPAYYDPTEANRKLEMF